MRSAALLAFSFYLSVLSAGCSDPSDPAASPALERSLASAEDPADVLSAAFVARARQADDVIYGEVVSTEVSPCTPGTRVVCTEATLHVSRSIRRVDASDQTVTLFSIGGDTGEDTIVSADDPLLRLGDRAVVFLTSEGELAGLAASRPNGYLVLDGNEGYLRVVETVDRTALSPEAYLDLLEEELQ